MSRLAAGAPELPEPPFGQHWVFHRGALGDSVLLWPMLRYWKRRGLNVVLVADRSKVALAERELGIRGEDAESPRFNRLWVAGAEVEPVRIVQGVSVFLGPDDEGLGTWRINTKRMFPSATMRIHSERPDRLQALRYPLALLNPCDSGAVVLHIGAGSESKRWPLDRWLALVEAMFGTNGTRGACLIAGEVEREKLSASDQRSFAQAGGRFIFKLDDLASAIRSARTLVAADSGPGHLAAQLGVPTVSLFGPTDPSQWGPVGPAVRVVAPPNPRSMDWLEPGEVLAAIREMSHSVYGKPG